MYKTGGSEEVLSMVDVPVAFLQSDAYGPDEMHRYVSLRSYPGGPVQLPRF